MGAFRLLLAIAVVVAHASPPFGVASLEMTGGPLAVQIFYVISGFYMAMVLNRQYTGEGALLAFLTNRLLRLYPVFLVVLATTLLVAAILHASTGHDIDPLAHWLAHRGHLSWTGWLVLGASNITVVGQDLVSFTAVNPETGALYLTADFHRDVEPGWHFLFVPQAWTVAVELMFYALAPFVVRRRAWVIAALMIASLTLRVFLMRRWMLFHDPWTYRFFPTELALFLAGALAYRLYDRHAARIERLRGVAIAATITAIGVVALYRLLPDAVHASRYGLPLVLVVIPPLLPWVFVATRRSPIDRALGELSYPAYLVHYPLVFVLQALAIPWLDRNLGIVALVLTLALAYLLVRLVVTPIDRTRSRIRSAVGGSAP